MIVSDVFARVVEVIGGAAVLVRRAKDGAQSPAFGSTPQIPAAKSQGALPTLKMPTARGWSAGQKPVAASGLKVNAFASDLEHPRWIEVLPGGDVLVAEAKSAPGGIKSIFDYAIASTMRRAGAAGTSANRITRLRDADGDGAAEMRDVFLDRLNQPFGMALVDDTFYVGNTDGLVAFRFDRDTGRPVGPGKKLAEFKPGGHWTRSLLASPDGKKLYAGVGSQSNIGERGMAAEEGRAAIYEVDLASGANRIFAGGLRNPVGLAFEPVTGMLWTVVNERDGLGDETPPDYLTSVREFRLLRLAILLLGQDGGRPRPAGCGFGLQSVDARLCPWWTHRFPRPLLDARRHVAGFSRRDGDRPARLVEPQHAQRLQGDLRSVRKRSPVRAAAGHPVGLPRARREGILRTARRSRDRSRQLSAGGG